MSRQLLKAQPTSSTVPGNGDQGNKMEQKLRKLLREKEMEYDEDRKMFNEEKERMVKLLDDKDFEIDFLNAGIESIYGKYEKECKEKEEMKEHYEEKLAEQARMRKEMEQNLQAEIEQLRMENETLKANLGKVENTEKENREEPKTQDGEPAAKKTKNC